MADSRPSPPDTSRGCRKTVRSYRVGPVRRWILWITIGPLIGLLLFLASISDPSERSALLFVAGFVFLVLLPFQFMVDHARLALSETGISLRQVGYRLESTWEEIEELRLERGREGFVTRKPIMGSGAARLARFRFATSRYVPLYDVEQQRLLGERRLIPIEAFAWHLRRGDLGDALRRFAPDLLKGLYKD